MARQCYNPVEQKMHNELGYTCNGVTHETPPKEHDMAQHKPPHIKKPADTGVLGDDCGHHCGVITTGLTDQKQAHCPCKECHSEEAVLREVPTNFTMSADGVDPRGIR